MAIQQPIAFFDFDGTLTYVTCLHQLLLIRRELSSGWTEWMWYVTFCLRIPIFYILYKRDPTLFNNYYFREFTGFDTQQVKNSITNRVVPFLRCAVFSDAEQEIKSLKKKGYRIILISASLREVIEPVAQSLGIHDFIATELAVADGKYSGHIQGDCIDNHVKAMKIKAFIKERGLSLVDSVGYGNSRGDIPMLETVSRSIVINPDKRLRRWANRKKCAIKNWPRPAVPCLRIYFSDKFKIEMNNHP